MKPVLVGLSAALVRVLLAAARPHVQDPGKPALGEAQEPRSSEVERKIMGVLAELDQQRRGNLNVPVDDGRLLRLLVEATGARNVIELGTSNGYSGIWMCLGLRADGGHLTTFDIDPARAEKARLNFEKAVVTDLVTIVLGDAHETVQQLKDPIDLVFIDADKQGYLDYLRKLRPLVRKGGLIVSHNLNRPAPDPEYLEAITTDPGLETMFFHMDVSGIAVTLKKY